MPSCYKQSSADSSIRAHARHQRLVNRRATKQQRQQIFQADNHSSGPTSNCMDTAIDGQPSDTNAEHVDAALSLVLLSEQEFVVDQATQTSVPTSETGVQTVVPEVTMESVLEENEQLKQLLEKKTFGVLRIQGDDSLTMKYTGLPTWGVFLHLVLFLTPFSPNHSSTSSLSIENEILLTLMRLKLSLFIDDLAIRFGTSAATVCRIFQKWIDIMFVKLKFLISWPSKEKLRSNMPPEFIATYPNCCCIIDCSEIFIEMPTNYTARAQTYSDYKKHNTVKFLIAVTPCGSISFVSNCWGGRVSDKQLTQESSFLNYLDPGDVVLADRGFTVAEDIAIHGARLEIPPFTRGKDQLSQREVELAKQLSQVRIHVERVIGLLKNKYTILKGPLPVNLLKHKGDKEFANIDKLLIVCCALCNLHNGIIKL